MLENIFVLFLYLNFRDLLKPVFSAHNLEIEDYELHENNDKNDQNTASTNIIKKSESAIDLDKLSENFAGSEFIIKRKFMF